MAALRQLLAPISTRTFLARYWEQKPLRIGRPLPGWCRTLPRSADMDALLACTAARDIRIVRASAGKGTETTFAQSDNRPDMAAIYRAYGEGWSMVVNGVDRMLPAVRHLAAELADTVSHSVGVNLYFTPPGAQGFAPHADGHDVFILQTDGRKRWRVFAPVIPLPLEDQEVPVRKERLGPCLIDTVLRPGEVLYMPRGFVHEGVAGKEASLHLTIGIHAVRWFDLAKEVLTAMAGQDVRLRESVTLDALAKGCSAELVRRLAAVAPALADPKFAEVACGRVYGKAVRSSRPAGNGRFSAMDRAGAIPLRTIVARRPGLICQVRRQGRRAVLEFAENSIDGPAGIEGALRFVSENRQFAVRDLPDELTNGSKVLLVSRLIVEGLLTVRK